MSRGRDSRSAANGTGTTNSNGNVLKKRGSKPITRSRSPLLSKSSSKLPATKGVAVAVVVAAGDNDHANDVHQELERLRAKYATLLQKHRALRQETTELKDVAILPHVWTPYIKFMFLWAITALILFALAERQLENGYEMAFGALATLGGTAIFMTIPATHLAGRWVYSDYKLFQPLQGGIRFFIFQAISWSFYGITTVIILLAVVYAEEYNKSGVLSSAGVIGVLSQVFMVSSLLTYKYSSGDSMTRINFAAKAESEIAGHEGERVEVQSLIDPHPSKGERPEEHLKASTSLVSEFMRMNFAVVLLGVVLAFISEHTVHGTRRMVVSALSLVCFIVGICLTHGLGGLLRHSEKGWRFSQMFKGGKRFVYYQVTGWSLFGAVLVLNTLFMFGPFLIGTQVFPGAMYLGGFAGMCSQILLSIALNHYKAERRRRRMSEVLAAEQVEEEVNPRNYRALEAFGLFEGLAANTVLFLLSNTQYIYIFTYLFWLQVPHITGWLLSGETAQLLDHYSVGLIPNLAAYDPVLTPINSIGTWFSFFGPIVVWVVTYSTLKNFDLPGWVSSIVLAIAAVLSVGACLDSHEGSPHRPMLIVFATGNFVYMSTTHTKMPEHNACREWSDFRKQTLLFRLIEKYFSFKMVLTPELEEIAEELGKHDARKELRQVIMGFHPHGIFPITHAWVSSCLQWREKLPNLNVHALTASIIHVVPIMRDVAQWLGGCDVSKKSLYNLLSMGKSVEIVIGGQTEMFESRSWDKEIMLVRKKRKGIFKIAIQHGLGILPMYCFGEPQAMDNVYLPMVQSYTKKVLGLPIPYVPYGRWFLPMPRRVPLTLVLDKPVFPKATNPNPSTEEIMDMQTRYFDALEALFERYKADFGHADHTIKWMDS